MPKRYRFEDLITEAIITQNHDDFKNFTILSANHLKLLYENGLLFKWITRDTDFPIDDFMDYIAKDDRNDVIETFGFLPFIPTIIKYNAIKCFTRFIQTCLVSPDFLLCETASLEFLQILHKKTPFNSKLLTGDLTILDIAILYSPKKIIEWIVQSNVLFWNASKSLVTWLERDYFMKLTKTLKWDDCHAKLSICKNARTLRNDKYIKNEEMFKSQTDKNGNSFLFTQLYYEMKYKNALKFFIDDVSEIIQDYLVLDKRDFFNGYYHKDDIFL